MSEAATKKPTLVLRLNDPEQLLLILERIVQVTRERNLAGESASSNQYNLIYSLERNWLFAEAGARDLTPNYLNLALFKRYKNGKCVAYWISPLVNGFRDEFDEICTRLDIHIDKDR